MGVVFIRMAQAEQDPAFATSLVPVGKWGRSEGRVNFVEIHRRYPAAGPWNVDIVRLLEQGGRW